MTTLGDDADSEDDFDLDRRVNQRVSARRAALQAVRQQRKDLTLSEAIELVTAIFTVRGEPAPHSTDARAMARAALDRFWPWSHPITAYREGWFWHQPE